VETINAIDKELALLGCVTLVAMIALIGYFIDKITANIFDSKTNQNERKRTDARPKERNRNG
jgi:uncharacterized membrane protein